MDLYEFIRMKKEDKLQLIFDLGIFLLAKPYHNGMVNLYGLGDFYVEVYHNKQIDSIEDIQSFRGVAGLEEYLATVDLRLLI